MLNKAESQWEIRGLKIARHAPPITHLLFADDSLLYCRAKDEELSRLKNILQDYSCVSGQRINHQKSSIFFGKLISGERRREIKRAVGIEKEGGEGKYLGLPEVFKGSKVQTFSYLKDCINQRVKGWQAKFLSPGGKEVLLKAVAMALPTYTMACFRLPKTCCKQIAAILASYWWKNKHETKGIHWKKWGWLSKSKKEGGLGFKDIETFNVAMLRRQLWRLVSKGDSLLARVYKSRYYQNGDALNAPLGSRPSFAWRSIRSAQALLKAGCRAVIGNGESIDIWKTPWIGMKPAKPLLQTNNAPAQFHQRISESRRVAELLHGQGREWKQDLLEAMVPREVLPEIRKLRPGGEAAPDVIAWDYSKSGLYTVKTGYWVLRELHEKAQREGEMNQPSLDHIYKIV